MVYSTVKVALGILWVHTGARNYLAYPTGYCINFLNDLWYLLPYCTGRIRRGAGTSELGAKHTLPTYSANTCGGFRLVDAIEIKSPSFCGGS